MNYFLTGATGFVGGRVARLLREAGHEVTALVRSPERARDLAALGVQLAPGDVIDQPSMRGPMAGADGGFSAVPPHVETSITPPGRTTVPAIDGLRQWGALYRRRAEE